MIKIQEETDGTLVFLDGESREPVADPEMQALLRSLSRVQGELDKDGSPEKVAQIVVTSLARLVMRLGATMALRLQSASGVIEEIGEAVEQQAAEEPPAPEGILLSIDEARLIVNPLFAAANLFGGMAQAAAQAPQDPTPGAPNKDDLVRQHQELQQALGLGGSRIAFGLRAYELAAAEEAAAEAAEEAEGAEDDGDEEEDDGDDEGEEA